MLIDRQVLILQSIVENFITTNQPVGSKQIAQNIDFSSATIRNDMSVYSLFFFLFPPI